MLFSDTDIVFLCSGQGSQAPGMGRGLSDIPEAREVIACASDIFGRDMQAYLSDDQVSDINETINAQAAITTTSIALGIALEQQGIMPACVLGFSLGQISALALSGMLSVEDTFKLASERARIMDHWASVRPGAMSALLKSDEEHLTPLIEQVLSEGVHDQQGHVVGDSSLPHHGAREEVLVAANYNCPGQIVISGDEGAVVRASALWQEQGGRAIRIATSGGFHSPLMQGAAEEFAAWITRMTFQPARIPLICNVDASPLTPEHAADHLVKHFTHPVRFEQSVRMLCDAHAEHFIEVGYGSVLVGLVKRIAPRTTRMAVSGVDSFKEALTRYGIE